MHSTSPSSPGTPLQAGSDALQHPPGTDPVPLLLPWLWARTAHPGSLLSCQEEQIPEEFWLGAFVRARRMRSQGWHQEPKSCGNLHWGIKPRFPDLLAENQQP